MLRFNSNVSKHEIISKCAESLPNPNDFNKLTYKVSFIIQPFSAFLPQCPDTIVSPKVNQAFFKMEYNESGARMWEFDRFDNDIKTRLIYYNHNWDKAIGR